MGYMNEADGFYREAVTQLRRELVEMQDQCRKIEAALPKAIAAAEKRGAAEERERTGNRDGLIMVMRPLWNRFLADHPNVPSIAFDRFGSEVADELAAAIRALGESKKENRMDTFNDDPTRPLGMAGRTIRPEDHEPTSESPNHDPIVNPRVGDKVRGKWRNPSNHVGTQNTLTVQAVVGNLIAVTTSARYNDITWIHILNWCQTDEWTSEWEVLHVAEG